MLSISSAIAACNSRQHRGSLYDGLTVAYSYAYMQKWLQTCVDFCLFLKVFILVVDKRNTHMHNYEWVAMKNNAFSRPNSLMDFNKLFKCSD